ncbi:tetratricopeptide repeat-containing protein [Pseudoduganella umbonata]|uniref:DUF4071 domain-containing protein n=1 Tax=Pseudoduganella umbonata TaxID=864828 RepID=A0A4P8HKS9_9BURK|nr:hypothetical protein [Pseudoduganella umbonata]MBB3221011.1 hypothetical protein [Pseudoduganella umbonata]QCP10217.1 hypothetical protein FCL38_07110 [Pseudoduganella umbonata]
MRVFVIRPFGTKEGIDFERVDTDLIQGALALLRARGRPVSGGGTGLISQQGNIRDDMFRLIALSDLVIADVSIHNANVFYELGMRHALRRGHTFLIRAQSEVPYPFDLQTDRYFIYDAADPGARVPALASAIESTLAATRPDSPMFLLLPRLAPHGRGQLAMVPPGFREEVERAHNSALFGKLRLLADEASAFEWDQEGLRLVGDAQIRLRAYNGARDTFERLQRAGDDDTYADLRLATIYQRLAMAEPQHRTDLVTRSEQALARVLAGPVPGGDCVEALSLSASNRKSAWIDQLDAAPAQRQQEVTLRSVHFENMLALYLKAAGRDLNGHYAAINALAALKIRVALAAAHPGIWSAMFDDEATAHARLTSARLLAERLAATLCLALGLDDAMDSRAAEPDPWLLCSRADYLVLTPPGRPAQIERAYRKALTGADRFALEATRRNLALYRRLGLFEPGVGAALDVLDELAAAAPPVPPAPSKVLLFTGHMVDGEDRPPSAARFPRTDAACERARGLIRDAVQREIADCRGTVLGIAGGACGGDTLFHEICLELGVRTELYLALPPDRFEACSVRRGGAGWVKRYRILAGQLPTRILQTAEPLPAWLVDRPDYDLWQRTNLWMLYSALATGARDPVLIALHNRQAGTEGAGGTAHLIDEAARWGFRPVELDAAVLLDS